MRINSYQRCVLSRLATFTWLAAVMAFPFIVSAQFTQKPDVPLVMYRELLAKAQPDECFFAIGSTNNAFSATGIVCQACTDIGGKPKVNQAYVWGLAKTGDDVWIGTGANVNSLVIGGYLDSITPISNSTYVAEFGQSAFVRNGIVPPQVGDWRPPDIFVYNTRTHALARLDESMPVPDQALLNSTMGFRSAGASAPNSVHTNGVVILSGPGLPPATTGGITMFAFDAASKTLIKSIRMTQYVNIRKWLLFEDTLYTAVTTAEGDGQVLKWVNNPRSKNYPFDFLVVGNLDAGGSELAVHDRRMFVSTWPSGDAGGATTIFDLLLEKPGIWMSPAIPRDGGLRGVHADDWSKIWQTADYETDQVVSVVTGGGALHSFGGYLYWGTMNVPGTANDAHSLVFGEPTNNAAASIQNANTARAVAVFRAKNFREGIFAGADIEMLYGETNLPSRNIQTGIWTTNANNMGVAPLYGRSGFRGSGGSSALTYTWTMAVYKDQLFVGTPDSAGGIRARTNNGAHLYVFTSANEPAFRVSSDGVGNYSSYGIRTMLADSNALYMGMANPMNLMTDLTDDRPEGGWEVVRLTRMYNDRDWDGLSDEWETLYAGGVTNAVPTDNPDGDKHNNLQEFITGNNPLLSADVFSITNSTSLPGGMALSWYGHTNRLYHVLQSTNLVSSWLTIGSVTGANANVTFTVPTNASPFNSFQLQVELVP